MPNIIAFVEDVKAASVSSDTLPSGTFQSHVSLFCCIHGADFSNREVIPWAQPCGSVILSEWHQ